LNSAFAFYNGVSLLVSTFNFGVQLTVFLGGADPNSSFVQGWNTFSDNFTRYATPFGWGMSILQAAGINIFAGPPSFDEQMHAYKSSQLDNYNVARYSRIKNSVFDGNSSGGVGGALSISYDNVEVQRCIFEKNNAAGHGGAIFCSSWTTPRIANSAFWAN